MHHNMDKIVQYRKIIQRVLKPYGEDRYVNAPTLTNQVIIDETNDHYLVVTLGWDGEMPVRDCIFHIDIKDGKVWIQEDNSDEDMATILMEEGIPPKDIVLGFQSPSMRKFSAFAAA